MASDVGINTPLAVRVSDSSARTGTMAWPGVIADPVPVPPVRALWTADPEEASVAATAPATAAAATAPPAAKPMNCRRETRRLGVVMAGSGSPASPGFPPGRSCFTPQP